MSRFERNRSQWNRQPETRNFGSQQLPSQKNMDWNDFPQARTETDLRESRSGMYESNVESHRYPGSNQRWSQDYGDRPNFQNSEYFRHRNEDSGPFVGRGPKGYQRSDERIKEDVCEALESHPGVDASEVEVDVKDGIVYLRGTVDDREMKRMAEDAVLDCFGVHDVRNELQLGSHFQNAGMINARSDLKSSNVKGRSLR